MSVQGLEQLKTWKQAKEFALSVFRQAIPLLPTEEKWNLNQQMRRAAQSIPANIAEGYGRYYYQENIRFCYLGRGSLEETLSHLVLAYELDYLPKELYERLIAEGDALTRLINGYISYLKRTRSGENEPGAPHRLSEPSEQYFLETPDLDSSD